MTGFAKRLCRDERGATIIEFAMVAPVMCMMLMAGFDISHTLYTRSTLQGVVQKTARDATLEEGGDSDTQAALDAKVTAQVKAMHNNADIVITRRFYRTFAEAAAQRAETFTDTNSNGKCDAGEPYQDENNNSVWDVDGGNAGQGGAKDATLYTVKVSYQRIMPIWKIIGGSNTAVVTASTILKNQPFGDQGSYAAPTVRNCP